MSDAPIPEQRVFSMGSSRGTMGKEGLEQMKKNRLALFPDFPKELLDHPRLCQCYLCGAYFGERCPNCKDTKYVVSSQQGRCPDSPLGFTCDRCAHEW